MPTPHVIVAEDAERVRAWMRDRGGIAIWRSINLSNPGASWTTPLHDEHGGMFPRPNWQCDIAPTRIITNPADLVVVTTTEVARFKVALQRSGFKIECTRPSSRKIRKRLADLGEGHFYRFDYGTQECVFYREGPPRPLMES